MQREEIEHLDDNTLKDLEKEISDKDNQPVPLSGLKNSWYTLLGTNQGSFHINIIQTDIS